MVIDEQSTGAPAPHPATEPAPGSPRGTGLRSARTTMESLDRTTVDPGYFGPDSISWRVHHDPVAVLGGIRGLFIESLHPDVMRGFYDITGTRDDPWGRLSRTGTYLNAVTYGTVAEADAAAARVRRVHAGLRLDRPDWLLWVHCAAADSWIEGHRRSGAPMSDSEADRYVEEQVVAARLIGCDVAHVPSSTAELAEYLRSMRTLLDVTAETREAARSVLWPPMTKRVAFLTPARPAWTTLSATGFALMPRWARRMFALPGLPTTDLAATVSARALRGALVAVPDARRTNPHLAAARIRLGIASEGVAG